MRREALPSVSTLEYFIHSSRLDRDAALAGMPYPSQGFCLDEHWVNKLWAGSPMDKAGVKLGDLIWSLDKDTESPQDTKKMLTQLAAPGDHDLFIYSPANPDNGAERNEFHAGNFSPKRRKVALTRP
jgi:hypothetical protein